MATDSLRKTKTPSDIDAKSPGIAPVVGEGNISGPIKASPTREYVAAIGALWYGPYVRTLPQYIDDLSDEFGGDTYERMMYDPTVSKCINDLRVGILENSYEVLPVEKRDSEQVQSRFGKAPKNIDPKSQEISNFCESVLDNLDRPFDDYLFEMLLALAYGNKISELIYHIQKGGVNDGKLVLRDIRTKARENTAFVVDNFNNVLGIMGFVPGVAWPVMPLSVLADPSKMPNILPRDKFAILSHRPINGDPRGTSLLRPAYNGWWLKQQTWGEYLKWLVQSAGSAIYGTTAEGAQPVPVVNVDGTVDTVAQTPEEVMVTQLAALQNGSVAAFPFGATANALPVNHESGKAFAEAISVFDRQIVNAILGQTLATEEGQGAGIGSGTGAQTHADILSQIKLYERNMLCRMVRREILRPLVRYNFGDEAVELTPSLSMGATDAGDFAADASAAASIGYKLDQSQFADMDSILGVPARSPNWQAEAAQRQSEATKKNTNDSTKSIKFDESRRSFWDFWKLERK